MRRGSQRGAMGGVGLIEVLIALVVIAGGVLALSRMQGLLLADAADSRQQAEASFLAQQVVEQLRSRDWNHATLQPTVPAATQTVAGTTSTFTVQTDITDAGVAGQMQFKTVQVTVTWPDAQGQVRSYSVSTRVQPLGAVFSGLVNL